MPVTLNIVETETELGITSVEVVIESASAPGPAGPGVPAGGTIGQVLAKNSGTDYDTEWSDAAGGGAPTGADYLVGSAHAGLSAEIVVGTSPGGELGGTWAAPTVDATHSGSSHAAVQAAAEATAAADATAKVAAEAALARNADNLTSGTVADARVPASIARDSEVTAAVAAEAALARNADNLTGGTVADARIAATIARDSEVAAAYATIDEPIAAAHIADATDAHDASAISIADAGNDFTATDVEGALAELQADHEADVTALSDHAADTTSVHGIADTTVLETTSGAQAKADAKVADAINNGTTTVAPSQNAVFDALALKAVDADVVHDTGDETIAGVKTFSSDPLIPDEAYDATAWNGSLEPPTKNAVRDKIESLSGGVTDGDKGDITVSSSGSVWTIDNSAVTLAKLANIATARILGRDTAGSGVVEELTAAEVKTLLAIVAADISDFDTQVATTAVLKSLFDANTILAATSDNTPAALTVAASTFIGRKATGDISAMSVAEAVTLLAASMAAASAFTGTYAPLVQGSTLGYAQATSNQGSISSETDLTGLSVTVTVGSGRRIRITGHIRPASTATADVAELRIKESTTVLALDRATCTPANSLTTLRGEVILTPSAGSHTYKLALVRDSGSGTLTSSAGATFPAYILVQDIGT